MKLPILLAVVAAIVPHRAPTTARVAHLRLSDHDGQHSHVVSCAGVIDVDAVRVVAGWSGMIGRRVRLPMYIERTIDFTLAIGVSGGHCFAIVLSPDATWTGTASKVFVVTGSRAVRSGGRVILPELMLDDGVCDE